MRLEKSCKLLANSHVTMTRRLKFQVALESSRIIWVLKNMSWLRLCRPREFLGCQVTISLSRDAAPTIFCDSAQHKRTLDGSTLTWTFWFLFLALDKILLSQVSYWHNNTSPWSRNIFCYILTWACHLPAIVNDRFSDCKTYYTRLVSEDFKRSAQVHCMPVFMQKSALVASRYGKYHTLTTTADLTIFWRTFRVCL